MVMVNLSLSTSYSCSIFGFLDISLSLLALVKSGFRLRQIDPILPKFRRPLSQSVLALSALFGRRRGIDNLLDRLRGELLSAQPRPGFLTGFASVLTFSPSSTKRRMASGRDRSGACFSLPPSS